MVGELLQGLGWAVGVAVAATVAGRRARRRGDARSAETATFECQVSDPVLGWIAGWASLDRGLLAFGPGAHDDDTLITRTWSVREAIAADQATPTIVGDTSCALELQTDVGRVVLAVPRRQRDEILALLARA